MFNMSSHRPLATNEMYEEFLHLKEFKVPFVCSSEAKVLIGAKAPDVFQQLETHKETHDQPDAIKKTLGRSLFGKQNYYFKGKQRNHILHKES